MAAMQFSSVVFPDPLGPMMAIMSPRSTRSSSPFRTGIASLPSR